MADSNSFRIRGQEVTVLLQVNGVPQAGSFAKVTGGGYTSRTDITNTGFAGEAEDEPDIIHNGWDIDFGIHEQDNTAIDNVWLPIIEAATSSSPQVSTPQTGLPTIDVIFIKKYRDPKLPPVTLTFTNVKIKLERGEFSDRKSYWTNRFTGSARKMLTS